MSLMHHNRMASLGVLGQTLFEVERHDDTLIVSSLGSFNSIPDDAFTAEVNSLLESFEPDIKSVVVDLHNTRSCTSDRLIGPLIVLWNRVRGHHGKLAICGLCKYGREVLRRTRLHLVWTVCPTREDALQAVSA
jgi:hypothetical protein